MTLIGQTRFKLIRKPSVDATNGSGMGAKARAELLANLAGNTRHAHEFTNGVLTTIGSVTYPPCAPISPHGKYLPGHDHSGGRYGVPITRNMWSAWWGGDETMLTNTGTNVELLQGQAPYAEVDAATTEATFVNTEIRTTWIPNCSVDGAHHHAAMHLRVYCTGNASVSLVIITSRGRWAPTAEAVVAGLNTVTFSSVRGAMLKPGALQRAQLVIKLNYTSGVVANGSLLSASLLQTKGTA